MNSHQVNNIHGYFDPTAKARVSEQMWAHLQRDQISQRTIYPAAWGNASSSRVTSANSRRMLTSHVRTVIGDETAFNLFICAFVLVVVKDSNALVEAIDDWCEISLVMLLILRENLQYL